MTFIAQATSRTLGRAYGGAQRVWANGIECGLHRERNPAPLVSRVDCPYSANSASRTTFSVDVNEARPIGHDLTTCLPFPDDRNAILRPQICSSGESKGLTVG
jgi:hypothetical protein